MTSTHGRRGRTWGRALLAAALTAGVAVASSPAQASNTVPVSGRIAHTWGVNGRVLAILPIGNKVVLGGEFTAIAGADGEVVPAGHVAVWDSVTGRFDPVSFNFDGDVNSLTTDGTRIFAAGTFKNIGTFATKFVGAAYLATGQPDTNFKVTYDKAVDVVRYHDGKLYVGGLFTSVKVGAVTNPQPYLMRLNATNAAFDNTFLPVLNSRARALLPTADGQSMYVGGDFSAVNNLAAYTRLVRMSLSTAQPDPTFLPGPTNLNSKAPVRTIVSNGSQLLVAVTGSGGACALLNESNGAVQWSKHGNGDMVSAVFFGPYSYCGGHFSGTLSFDGLDRNKMAAVDTATGVTQDFQPLVNSALGVFAMDAGPDAIYIGGDFTKVDTVDQAHVGMFRATDAILAPTRVESLVTDAGDANVQLSWSTPSTDGGQAMLPYRIYRSENGNPAELVGQTLAQGFQDTTVTNGVVYTYTVVARNSVGDAPASPAVTAAPVSGQIVVPSAPQSLLATGGVSAADLTWTAPQADGGAPITAYNIYRSESSGTQTLYATVPGTQLTYHDTAVAIGTRYYYKVAAVNSVGEGPHSVENSAVPNSGVPSAPDLFLDSLTGTSVSLSWTAPAYSPTPVTKYILVRDAVKVGVFTPTTFSFTDTGVVSGRHYVYQIRAFNSYGTSKWSNSITVTIP